MSALTIQREERAGRLTLRLEGTFDGSTALELRRSLAELPEQDVVIDFTRVRRFQDAAVSVLSRNLAHARLQLQGLDSHQERMFRYCGVPTGRTSAREQAYYTPEELLGL